MKYEVAFTSEANKVARDHLLQFLAKETQQEELCFALWRPSIGKSRYTAIISMILLPKKKERSLHVNASFNPEYLIRAIETAQEKNMGLAFMHSHFTPGWQGMSEDDVKAECDVIAPPAITKGFPLVGLTIGTDGYWSARFWRKHKGKMCCYWCDKVRVVNQKHYSIFYNDHLLPPLPRKNILRRTTDVWGLNAQQKLERLKVGIVGLGSVGSVVAEMIARIGVGQVVLIDHDRIKEHNLDRTLNSTIKNIGAYKVKVAKKAIKNHAAAKKINIEIFPVPIQNQEAYKAALDCDVLFSCVDRAMPREALNYIANACLIPVIDGGIATTISKNKELNQAHWKAHIITPYHQCLRCNRQYTSSAVTMEFQGLLDDPSYVRNLPEGQHIGNQNVLSFSMNVASMEVNLMLRYLLGQEWWPPVKQQEYDFLTGEIRCYDEKCFLSCKFKERKAMGDIEEPFFIKNRQPTEEKKKTLLDWFRC